MSYLPPLSAESISKEIEFIMSKGWVPCLEFDKVQTKHIKLVRTLFEITLIFSIMNLSISLEKEIKIVVISL